MFVKTYKISSNFDSNLLICDSTVFPGKKSPNIANRNRVFPGKGRGGRALIFNIFGWPNGWNFSPLLLIFSDFGHLYGETGGQSSTNSANFGSISFSWKLESFKFCSNNVFVYLSTTSDKNFGNIGPYLGEYEPRNLSEKTIS